MCIKFIVHYEWAGGDGVGCVMFIKLRVHFEGWRRRWRGCMKCVKFRFSSELVEEEMEGGGGEVYPV